MTDLILSRRKFLTNAAILFCAPAIIRVADLMAIKAYDELGLDRVTHPADHVGLLIEEQRTNWVLQSMIYIPRRLTNEELLRLTS
jgi:hypothetical protein